MHGISTLCKFLVFARAYEAPRPRQRPEPSPLPELQLPNTQVYTVVNPEGSQTTCSRAVHDFRERNTELCQRLRELIGDANVTYKRWSSNATKPWGARLCTDPELPPGDYDTCDATFFCRVTSNLTPCPQSFLQEHINHIRFRMKCAEEDLKVYLTGNQPDTVAGCYTPSQIEAFREAEKIKQEKELMNRFPDSKVFVAEGTIVYAKPAPYIHPRFTCMDYDGSTRKHEL